MKRLAQFTLAVVVVAVLGIAVATGYQVFRAREPVRYGATFSPAYARFLGLDDHEVFIAVLEELELSDIRLPVHWDEVEPDPGRQKFAELDWFMDTAAEHDTGVVLAIGNKVPRWPECYAPGWAKTLDNQGYEQALLDYLESLVERYREHPALVRWQVENETLFAFGECPPTDYRLFQKEIELVRSLDSQHPIQLTVSGEQQLWLSLAGPADVIGASMYRRVALPNGWPVTFPIPPQWYSLQALSAAPWVDNVVISELQAEPWLTKDYREYPVAEAAELFTPKQLGKYLRYARATGLKDISVWGVEWWYYLKHNGQPELWNAGREHLK
jgi:hypothetical protein